MHRLFICDPICVQTFGHNLSALHYFKEFLSEVFHNLKVHTLVSKYLPAETEDAKNLNLERVFHYYYQSSMELENYDSSQEELVFRDIVSPYNYLENLAYDDLDKIYKSYNLTEKDSIFFPSVDFYSAQALLRLLESKNSKKVPTIYLRFIGVMENNSKYYIEPREELFSMLRRLKKKDYPIKISAETPKYSDFIADRIESNVHCLTYPSIGDSYPLDLEAKKFKVFCPGNQREDKGFKRLFNIIKNFWLENPDTDIEFFLQEAKENHYINYNSNLYALPGVTLLSSSVTIDEMRSFYQNCHLILLPYDPNVYYLRGSAVLMEAISYGRLVLASDHAAFSDQVVYYNNGRVCFKDEDFSRSIREFYDMNKKKMQRRAEQSKFRYEIDCSLAYRSWFQC